MIKFSKKNIQTKNKIFFKSILGNFDIFFVDKNIKIPNNIQINVDKHVLFLKNVDNILSLKIIPNILIFYKKNQLKLIINLKKNKKNYINLYTTLIKNKIKGLLQEFKFNLILKGIGFKALIENDHLILKLGFSHNIIIKIPSNIKLINQSNILIFSGKDLHQLSQFVNYIRNFKRPEPYKGKGLLFKNEILIKKEGKKSKK